MALIALLGFCFPYLLERFEANPGFLFVRLGVNPLGGIPMHFIWASIPLAVVIAVYFAHLLVRIVGSFHDQFVNVLYVLLIEPWLLALYYVKSPDAELRIQRLAERSASRPAVDRQLLRHLESFAPHFVNRDIDELLADLGVPSRREIALSLLGAEFPERAALAMLDNIASVPPILQVAEMELLGTWLQRHSQARNSLVAPLEVIALDSTHDFGLRRRVSGLLRKSGLSTGRVKPSARDWLIWLGAPAELLRRLIMNLLSFLLYWPSVFASRYRPRGVGQLGIRVLAWCAGSHLVRPGPKMVEWITGELMARDVNERADGVLCSALSRHPNHAGLLKNLGNLRFKQSRFDEASAAFRRALVCRPDEPGLLSGLALSLAAGGDHRGARKAALRAVEMGFDNAPGLRLLTIMLLRMGSIDAALGVIESTLEKFPLDLVVWETKGDILRSLKRFAEATATYREALTRMPDNPDLLFGLALSLEGEAKFEEARAAAERAIELGPDDVKHYPLLVHLLLAANATDKAADLTEQAVRRFPTDAGILQARGVVLTKLNRHSEAADAYRTALTHEPDNVEFLIAFAWYLLAEGDPDEALIAAKRASELAPSNADGWNLIAQALREQGNLAEGRQVTQENVRRFPGYPQVLFVQGILYDDDERYPEAAGAYRAALEHDDVNTLDVLAALALSLCRGGIMEDAREVAHRLIEIAPTEPLAWQRLIHVLIESKDWCGASRRLDEALGRFPADPQILWIRGNFLVANHFYGQAATAYCEAMAAMPHEPALQRDRAEGLRLEGKLEEARLFLNSAEVKWPSKWSTGFLHAELEVDLNQVEDGVTRFEVLAGHPSEKLDASRLHSRLLLAKGNPGEALTRLEEGLRLYEQCGLRLTPHRAEGYELLRAEILLRLHRLDEALSCLQRIESPRDKMWLHFLVLIGGRVISPADAVDPLACRLLDWLDCRNPAHVEAVECRPGEWPQIPTDGISRMCRQACLLLEAEILRATPTSTPMTAAANIAAPVLSHHDLQRIQGLLTARAEGEQR
jgi:tetratricopeptide (TPR) repeat protein